MVRKTLSLLVVLSLFQASAFAATCDLDCLLAHSHHKHSAALPQPHHHHSSGHVHSAQPAQADDSVGAVPQCHQGVSTACSSDCVSKTSASASASLARGLRNLVVFNMSSTGLLPVALECERFSSLHSPPNISSFQPVLVSLRI